jgi:signal transduction histidine kinase
MQANNDHYLQLYQNARAMEANLRELSAQVLSAQEEERKRISRELHDEIGQALTAINVTIAMLKRQVVSDPAFQRNVADAEQLLERTMETVHSFARELRPAMLDHLGLQSALRAHILAFTRRTGIRTELVSHPYLSRLDERRGEVLFRVAQEALNNIFKHAGATTAKIEFTSTGDSLNMEVGDNGCAFNAEEHVGGKRNGCLGLLGMQERVRLVNGSFSIDSAAGSGTRIRVGIPINAQPKGRTRQTREDDGLAALNPHPDSYTALYEEDIRSAR